MCVSLPHLGNITDPTEEIKGDINENYDDTEIQSLLKSRLDLF
jgi:hypothetical protein